MTPPVVAAGIFLLLALLSQWLSGSYKNDFAGSPDEPAHYVTGLMLHDYLLTWPPAAPLRFAEQFYLHYPKVALGHWPPVFYMLQAGWMLLFSTSRASLLVLMAMLAAALAFTVYRIVRGLYDPVAALATATLLLLLPLIQQYTGMLMTEIPVALFCLWAALAFARYLDKGRWQDAARFGTFAALAIMTKGSALALALTAPLAMSFARRFELIRRKATWLAALIVAAICGPWYVLTFHMAENGWSETGGWQFVARAVPFNLWKVIAMGGPAIATLAVIGLYAKIVQPRLVGRRVAGIWASLGGLLVSVFVFQSLVPASLDDRHLITLAAPLIILVAAGIEFIAMRVRVAGVNFSRRTFAMTALTCVAFFAGTFAIPKQAPRGFSMIAQDLLARPEFAHSVLLVSSQHDGEGIFIAAIAMNEKRPGHVVLRGSKVLAESLWTEESYRLLYETPEAMMKYLASVPVGVLVLDLTPGPLRHPHNEQLMQMLQQYPDRWQLLGTYPKNGKPPVPGQQVRVYKQLNVSAHPAGKLRIDMQPMLGKNIE